MCALSAPMDAGHIDGLVAAVGKRAGGDSLNTEQTMSVLTPEQIAQYQQDGYTILRNALSAEEVSTLRTHIEGIASGDLPFPEANIEFDPDAPQQRHVDHLRKINGPSECDPFFLDHATREPILTAGRRPARSRPQALRRPSFYQRAGWHRKDLSPRLRVLPHRADGPSPPLGSP